MDVGVEHESDVIYVNYFQSSNSYDCDTHTSQFITRGHLILGAFPKFRKATISFVMSACLPACLPARLPARPSVRLSACLSVRLPVCPSVCLSVRLLVRPSVCLSVRLSVCLSVRPSVCPHGTTLHPLDGVS
jgi:hypothetical protein